MNYLVQPLLYSGSSFQDIWAGLVDAASSIGVPVEVVPANRPGARNLWSGLDEPREFAQHQAMQTAFLANRIRGGDRVLLPDFFAPGLELLQYVRERERLDMRFGALFHGASFVPGDLYDWPWLGAFEEGWLRVFDRIYCSSEWMARTIPACHREKAVVLPWGVHLTDLPRDVEKTYDVVFPHRWSADKGVADFVEIARALPSVRFVVTGFGVSHETPAELRKLYQQARSAPNIAFREREDREAHLRTLSSARVVLSTAVQEGFGYAVMKAVRCGCVPLLPNRCCYPEFFPDCYLFDSVPEAARMLISFLDEPPPIPPMIDGSFVTLLTSFFTAD